MATRREFLTSTATVAVTAAVLPVANAAPAASVAQAESANSDAESLNNELKRYTTMAAFAHGVPAPDA